VQQDAAGLQPKCRLHENSTRYGPDMRIAPPLAGLAIPALDKDEARVDALFCD
jgi:hypothetical protein